jgi:hypothetical protein
MEGEESGTGRHLYNPFTPPRDFFSVGRGVVEKGSNCTYA